MKNKKEVSKFLEPIFEEFLNDRKSDLKTLKQAFKENDYQTVQAIGHRLAGNAGSYELQDLGDLGDQLETAIKKNELNKVEDIILDIQNYLETLEVVFI